MAQIQSLAQELLCHGCGHTFKKKKKDKKGSSYRGAAEMNLTRNHEVTGSIPGLAQWVKDPVFL